MQRSFADYAAPHVSGVPGMIIDLIDAREDPTGAVETAIVTAPAIANAVAAMTGRLVLGRPWQADQPA
ncbi:hypothetical protein [Bosea sp. BIWAKO-01]|uniref:hypothetical protein n=1 Tax=Bosea sp. BIWAKO-01 TaxID=506668 RepID=UPI0008530835|nr:hypothetical protein [Bosea sp. BIWAKO-01]GAU86492.1 hypothetical protein BIWAKO_06440 [Bosea sp. BIWAKO-01]